jgi:hypothetical protein
MIWYHFVCGPVCDIDDNIVCVVRACVFCLCDFVVWHL